MQCNALYAHKDILSENNYYIGFNKYNAISIDSSNGIIFGDRYIDCGYVGNNIGIISNDMIGVKCPNNLKLISNTGQIQLTALNGITINDTNYGINLPSTGVEGQIFFKLIN